MQFLLLGIAAFLALMVIGRLILSMPPQTLARIVKIGATVIVAVVAIFLGATGRLGPALALAMIGVPFFMRWRAMARRMKTASGPTPGQRSAVRTAHLEAMLDHDSGEMDAQILDGVMAGRMLSDLSLEELLSLLADFRQVDMQSAAIVEAYLDRVHGADWRRQDDAAGQSGAGGGEPGGQSESGSRSDSRKRHSGRPSSGGRMTIEEARAALGVDKSATRDDIKSAHRHLMKRFHPDQGGTDYLAAKLNEAKEILLEYVED